MENFAFLQNMLDPWLVFLAEDTLLRSLQLGMLSVGLLVVFLVFYTTRDIILRTQSFWYMLFSIALVSALPVVGFLTYLLIRPARTIKEREAEKMLRALLADKIIAKRPQKKPMKQIKPEIKKKPVTVKK